jgi:hypothetical protein
MHTYYLRSQVHGQYTFLIQRRISLWMWLWKTHVQRYRMRCWERDSRRGICVPHLLLLASLCINDSLNQTLQVLSQTPLNQAHTQHPSQATQPPSQG